MGIFCMVGVMVGDASASGSGVATELPEQTKVFLALMVALLGFLIGGGVGLLITAYFKLPLTSENFTGIKVGGAPVTREGCGAGGCLILL